MTEPERDVFKHYVDGLALLESRVEGSPVTALCDKTWVPWRDPSKYPLCPTCRERFEELAA